MTTTEALGKLKARYACEKVEQDMHCYDGYGTQCDECALNYGRGNCGERSEAFRMAIEAMALQVPRLVDIKEVLNYKGETPYECPSCGGDLEPTENFSHQNTGKFERITWCRYCGQRLDWREINDRYDET